MQIQDVDYSILMNLTIEAVNCQPFHLLFIIWIKAKHQLADYARSQDENIYRPSLSSPSLVIMLY